MGSNMLGSVTQTAKVFHRIPCSRGAPQPAGSRDGVVRGVPNPADATTRLRLSGAKSARVFIAPPSQRLRQTDVERQRVIVQSARPLARHIAVSGGVGLALGVGAAAAATNSDGVVVAGINLVGPLLTAGIGGILALGLNTLPTRLARVEEQKVSQTTLDDKLALQQKDIEAVIKRELASQMTDIRAELASQMTDVRAELASQMTGVRAELASQMTNLNQELAAVRAQLATTDSRLARLEKEVAALSTRLLDLGDDVADVSTKVARLSAKIFELQLGVTRAPDRQAPGELSPAGQNRGRDLGAPSVSSLEAE